MTNDYPERRELDGIFFRIQRDGKWRTICISDMNKVELYEQLGKKDKEFLLGCIEHLVDTIREIAEFTCVTKFCGEEDD